MWGGILSPNADRSSHARLVYFLKTAPSWRGHTTQSNMAAHMPTTSLSLSFKILALILHIFRVHVKCKTDFYWELIFHHFCFMASLILTLKAEGNKNYRIITTNKHLHRSLNFLKFHHIRNTFIFI